MTAGQVIALADLGNLVYTPPADANGSGLASFTFSVQDSAGAFDAAPNTITVDVTAVNDAPTGANNTITTNEDTAHTFAAGEFGFSDVDTGDALQAVRIDTVPGTGSLQLSNVDVTAGQVIAVADLGNLVNTPPADANGNGLASFTFSVQDSAGAFDAAPNTVTVDVTAVNDAPTGADNTITTSEDTAHTFAAADFGFSDVDTGDTLQAVRIDTVPGMGTLQLSGVDVTAGQVIAAANLGNLVYTPPADANGSGLTSFTFSVQDSGNAFDAAPNTITVDVTAVNDPPTLSNLDGDTVTFTEDGVPVALDQNGDATVSVVDLPDFDGGNVTVAISAHNVPGEDLLLIDTSGGVALSAGVTVGSVVSVGGTDIGTITSDGQNGADLVVALNANSTGPLVQTLVRALHYSNTDTVSPDVTPRTVTVTIDDGDGGVTPGADVTVNVAAVNDLPGTTGAASISAAPDVPSVIGASAFNFTDGDPGDSLGAVRFDTVPNAATGQFFVDVNGDGVVDAGEAVAANDVVSIAAINAGQLKWLSPTGVSGTGTFTFTVQDTGGPAFAAASQIGTVTVAGVGRRRRPGLDRRDRPDQRRDDGWQRHGRSRRRQRRADHPERRDPVRRRPDHPEHARPRERRQYRQHDHAGARSVQRDQSGRGPRARPGAGRYPHPGHRRRVE